MRVGAACDIMAVLTLCEEVLNTTPHKRVLVDTGAKKSSDHTLISGG